MFNVWYNIVLMIRSCSQCNTSLQERLKQARPHAYLYDVYKLIKLTDARLGGLKD